jgi:hypothetical protein
MSGKKATCFGIVEEYQMDLITFLMIVQIVVMLMHYYK